MAKPPTAPSTTWWKAAVRVTIGEQTFIFRAKDIFVVPTRRTACRSTPAKSAFIQLRTVRQEALGLFREALLIIRKTIMTQYVFAPQAPISIPVVGSDEQFPVRRVYCVGQLCRSRPGNGLRSRSRAAVLLCKPAGCGRTGGGRRNADYRIRRRPTTIITKLSWWSPIGKGRDIPLEQAQIYIMGATVST